MEMQREEDKLWKSYERVLELYRQTYPPGTVIGNWRMGEDGLWWGRCSLISTVPISDLGLQDDPTRA